MDTLESVAELVWLWVYMWVGQEDCGLVCLCIVGAEVVGMRYLLMVWIVLGTACYWMKLVQALDFFSEWMEVWVWKTQASLVAFPLWVGGLNVNLMCVGGLDVNLM